MGNTISGQYTSIEQAANSLKKSESAKKTGSASATSSFADIFEQKISIAQVVDNTVSLKAARPVKFSRHAEERLRERNIELTDDQVQRLNDGTKKAVLKGIKETLVLMDDYSFIVNTENNTVVTAMDQKSSDENVYTNIDGAVIV